MVGKSGLYRDSTCDFKSFSSNKVNASCSPQHVGQKGNGNKSKVRYVWTGTKKLWQPILSGSLPLSVSLTMPAKATEEYRIALMSLLSQLSELERLGNDFFGKMYVWIALWLIGTEFKFVAFWPCPPCYSENTFSTAYNGPEAKGERRMHLL